MAKRSLRPQGKAAKAVGENMQANEIINKYKGMGEDELFRHIEANVKEGMREGTFDIQALKMMRQNAGNMLNSEQKRKLDELLKRIESISKI